MLWHVIVPARIMRRTSHKTNTPNAKVIRAIVTATPVMAPATATKRD